MISRLVRELAAVALGLALATGILAGAVLLTRSRLTAQAHASELAALTAVLPPQRYDNDPLADAIRVRDAAAFGTSAAVPVLRARRAGAPSALVLEAVAPDGYGGPIRLVIGVAADGSVLGVRVLEHRESPGFGAAIDAARSDWIDRFRGLSLAQTPPPRWALRRDGGDFDQLGGATTTSRALIVALRRVLEYVQAHATELYAAPAQIDAVEVGARVR